MIDRALAIAGLAVSVVSLVLPTLFPAINRKITWVGLACGILLLVAAGGIALLPDGEAQTPTPSSASVPSAEITCGEVPKDMPISVQEQLKGELEGKAQAVTKLLGSASLQGKIDTSRTELYEQHKNLDQHQIDMFYMWVLCQIILSDKNMSGPEKVKQWMQVRSSFDKQSRTFRPGEPVSNDQNSARLEVVNWNMSYPPTQDVVKSGITGISSDIYFQNTNDTVVITNRGSNYRFEYSEKPLSTEEEDAFMKVLDAPFASQGEFTGNEIPPKAGYYFTAYDNQFKKEQWDLILAGKAFEYLFVETEYSASSNVFVTERCFFINRDYPAIHNCLDHNRIFARG
jgi:hypothetical protein